MTIDPPSIELLQPSTAKSDIVRRFLAWAQSADAATRADGASALARAYLYSDLSAPARSEAQLAMTALLDDPSIMVRRALAEALCRSSDAPRALVLALAADEPDAAAPLLLHSPVLNEADLVDCVMTGDLATQFALARRPNLAPRATATLAEVGERDAIFALIGNVEIDLSTKLLDRILTRFNDDGGVRQALLERTFLPPALRARIAVAAAGDLAVEAAQWMPRERAERVAREARDQAICAIAASCEGDELAELMRALRAARALTPALLLRSLLGGGQDLFVAAMAELSGLPLARVAAFVREPRGEGFAALARRAGLKMSVMPAFRAALEAIKRRPSDAGYGLNLSLTQRVIDECEARDDPALAKALALLWRFAAEAAKAQAADFAREAAAAAPGGRLPPILDFSPVNDDAYSAPMLTGPAFEFSARAELEDDRAPRVESPDRRAAALHDAA